MADSITLSALVFVIVVGLFNPGWLLFSLIVMFVLQRHPHYRIFKCRPFPVTFGRIPQFELKLKTGIRFFLLVFIILMPIEHLEFKYLVLFSSLFFIIAFVQPAQFTVIGCEKLQFSVQGDVLNVHLLKFDQDFDRQAYRDLAYVLKNAEGITRIRMESPMFAYKNGQPRDVSTVRNLALKFGWSFSSEKIPYKTFATLILFLSKVRGKLQLTEWIKIEFSRL